MLILLPPSETKRTGGANGSRLELDALAFPALNTARVEALDALVAVSSDPDAARAALKLSARQAPESERNRTLWTAPVMPSIDRYDGVLFDALGAGTLPPDARAFAHAHLAISSALFGLTRALDPIPAYRMSADSRVPGIRPKHAWSHLVSAELASVSGVILDLRSEAYAALGPAPRREGSVYARVVTDEGGRRRALNHFNKAGKGRLVRSLLLAGIDHPDLASLLAWSQSTGIRLERGAPGELELVVEESSAIH
ncbi:YaaA family protein [Homoserinibacter sp. GY 40078]|uniref:YaaA family protein n=1 Tax=Homoserinibacter sp. GY 40078 TaxID=2603275 RepID=UPI0011C8C356|nr:peroxide stress protein YaaA [Homoserinibacter sp. GY 40078]TXK17274.1 peroxide stress protein YaaA [Homoserinibacter sp. GY 40078]